MLARKHWRRQANFVRPASDAACAPDPLRSAVVAAARPLPPPRTLLCQPSPRCPRALSRLSLASTRLHVRPQPSPSRYNDTFCSRALSGESDVGCAMHDIAQRLPGVPIAAIRVAISILVRGDWVYDCDAGDDDARWMCVRASAAAAAARLLRVCGAALCAKSLSAARCLGDTSSISRSGPDGIDRVAAEVRHALRRRRQLHRLFRDPHARL